jgi:hypothetical protein
MDKIRKNLSKLLNDTYKSKNRYLTNKTCRKIKSTVNRELCLLDHLFQGIHSDFSLISSHNNEDKEIDMICENFNRASYMVVKRAEKTINKWEDEKIITDKNLLEAYKRLIILGYEKYKKIKPKKNVNEIILAYEFYKYYQNIPSIINENELLFIENYLINSFPNYNPEILNNYFTLVIDITVDMKNGALERALFNCVFIVKFFKLKKIYCITNGCYLDIHLTEEDFNKSYLNLVSKIYLKFYGHNTFTEKLDIITKAPIMKKNILFLTNDTLLGLKNDTLLGLKNENKLNFHSSNYKKQLESYEYNNIKNNNIIILNLKKSKFSIPYYDSQKNITLIEGYKINTFFDIVKEIYNSCNLKFNINNIINKFIDLVEINNLEPIPIYKNILTEDKILFMYEAFKNNLAPLKF